MSTKTYTAEAERAARLITFLDQRLPEDSPERAFVPGVMMQALWESVADYGHDYDGQEMADILRQALDSGTLPSSLVPLVEQMVAFWHTYPQVRRELEDIDWEEQALPALQRIKEKAAQSLQGEAV